MRTVIKIFSLFLLLSLLVSLASCSKIEQFFGGNSDKDEIKDNGESLVEKMGPRVPGVYNFLLVREKDKAGEAVSFLLCQMDLPDAEFSLVQIPEDLYIRADNAFSLGQIYSNGYDRARALGFSQNDCAVSAAKAAGEALEKNLMIPVDYHIVASREAVVNYVDLIEGLEINLPFNFTTSEGITYPAGVRTLEGKAIADFLEYDMFRDYDSELNAVRTVLASIQTELTTMLSSENISIRMVQAKPFFATDLPTRDGYDIFFLRKLIQISDENWNVTELCTSPVSTEDGDFRVIHYNTVLDQLNSYLSLYREPIKARFEDSEASDDVKILDPHGALTDPGNIILNSIYKASKRIPEVYSAAEIYVGALHIFEK